MLTRVVKPNFDGLHEATKQLLIWALKKRQEFHTSCKCTYYGDRNYRDRNYRNSRRSWSEDHELHRKKVNFNINNLKSFQKNFYEPHPDVLNRSKEEVDAFCREHKIQVFGRNSSNCPTPIFGFHELNLPSETVELIRNLNYVKPTPVQSQTWPIVLSGLDMVGVSQTGSGKTLGFVLPGLIHIQNQPVLVEGEGPIGLIIAPTRELTQQIHTVTRPFAKTALLKTACIYGGSDKHGQRSRLYGAHICVATPGRLMDFLNDGTIKLDRCTYCVLDEADRLLDMGFEPQIRAILNQIRPDKQMSMWSATWPKEVQALAESYLRNYIGIKFGSTELTANPNITQHVHFVEGEREKINLLLKILEDLRKEKYNKTLIFSQTKRGTEFICHHLSKNGFRASFLHGDMSQSKREALLHSFKTGNLKILVGTSVVSRGIDINDIRYVINFDFPRDIEEYVHVIGRTARNNNPGTSHTFFTSENLSHGPELVKILETADQVVPDFLRQSYGKSKRKRFSQDFDEFYEEPKFTRHRRHY